MRVVIIEDNTTLRNAWKVLLESENEFEVLKLFSNCELAINDDSLKKADILILDIGLPGMSGIEGISHFKKANPKLIILMCSVYEDDDNIFNAISADAVGYLLKKTSPEEFIPALKDAFSGGSPMTPSIARKVLDSFRKMLEKKSENNQFQLLSDKEKQIIEFLSNGLSYQEIADRIHLSIDGVRYHIRKIYEKLEVNSRSEAIALAMKHRNQ
ncbi:MAG: response regulator transcription factor [Calditrichaeota bacterium]|nr:response regulator transcription factor [Calditrichota bacterium]